MKTMGVQLKLRGPVGISSIFYIASRKPRPDGRGFREADRSEMSNFCPDQGRTRVFGEAYACTPQPETRGERRAGQKGPFLDGH